MVSEEKKILSGKEMYVATRGRGLARSQNARMSMMNEAMRRIAVRVAGYYVVAALNASHASYMLA